MYLSIVMSIGYSCVCVCVNMFERVFVSLVVLPQEEAGDESSGQSSRMLYVVERIRIECQQTETTKLLLEPGMKLHSNVCNS